MKRLGCVSQLMDRLDREREEQHMPTFVPRRTPHESMIVLMSDIYPTKEEEETIMDRIWSRVLED